MAKYRKVSILKSDSRYKLPWTVRWYERTGKRPSVSFPTKALAQNYADQIRLRLNAGLLGTCQSVSWEQMTSEFLSHKKANRVKDRTIEAYLNEFDKFRLVNTDLDSDQIGVRHIDAIKTAYPDNSPATLNKALTHLHALFAWAIRRNYMTENPIHESGRLKTPAPVRATWSPQQFEEALVACLGSRDGDQWQIMVLLGINGVGRKSALTRLTVADIDFGESKVRCLDDKSGRERWIPLHPRTASALLHYINALPAGRVRLFSSKFSNDTWHRITERAGVPFVTFHHLRTIATTWLKSAGVSEAVTASVLGHSPEVSRKHYTQLDDLEIAREAVQKLPI